MILNLGEVEGFDDDHSPSSHRHVGGEGGEGVHIGVKEANH